MAKGRREVRRRDGEKGGEKSRGGREMRGGEEERVNG